MADDYYAWSNIRVGGDKPKVIRPGEKVSASDLGVDDDEFDNLVTIGSVRSTPWPEGLDPDNPNADSPNQHRLKMLAQERERLEMELRSEGGAGTSVKSGKTEKGGTPAKEVSK